MGGYVGITRLEAAPEASYESYSWLYKQNGNPQPHSSLEPTIEETIQDCAPHFNGTNYSEAVVINYGIASWKYRLQASNFSRYWESRDTFGDVDIYASKLQGTKDQGRIIYAAKDLNSGSIRISLDSMDRYKIFIRAASKYNEGDGKATIDITKL